jgi:hypothetical protein
MDSANPNIKRGRGTSARQAQWADLRPDTVAMHHVEIEATAQYVHAWRLLHSACFSHEWLPEFLGAQRNRCFSVKTRRHRRTNSRRTDTKWNAMLAQAILRGADFLTL